MSDENSEILISIVIPVKNGDQWLENLFQKLMQQTLYHQTEILVIDSGSTDNSLAIIKQYPVKLIQIPPHEFNHGDTRNLGVRNARGKFVVMTVQDAIPTSDSWLQYLMDGFINDTVAGVCGQQVVPHEPDKNPVSWFRPVSAPRKTFYQYDKQEDFLKLSPSVQRRQVGWDNVTSAYQREILLQFPFPAVDFAEDISWAREILLRGYTIGHNDEARVYHYHHQMPEFVMSRYFSEYYYEYKLFKLRPSLTQSFLRYNLVTIKLLLKASSISMFEKMKWLIFNIGFRIALQKTITVFNDALDKGEAFLDMQYRKICHKIPQAPKYQK